MGGSVGGSGGFGGPPGIGIPGGYQLPLAQTQSNPGWRGRARRRGRRRSSSFERDSGDLPPSVGHEIQLTACVDAERRDVSRGVAKLPRVLLKIDGGGLAGAVDGEPERPHPALDDVGEEVAPDVTRAQGSPAINEPSGDRPPDLV